MTTMMKIERAYIGNRMIHALSEGIAEKPSFRRAIRKQRCLVLADVRKVSAVCLDLGR